MSKHPASWNESPGAARERWHTEARERDEAHVATLPDDDSETADSPWAAGLADADGTETVHACPPPGSGLTPCCDRTPFDLSPADRMTTDHDLVTCGREEAFDGGQE